MGFLKTLVASFLGKVLATLLLAFCVFVGFSPDRLVASIIGGVPIPLATARIVFLVTATAVILLAVLFWLKSKSPLEILFDARNPGRRFWSLETQKDTSLTQRLPVCWQYRVDIRNKSFFQTLRNVRVSAEGLGQVGGRPLDMPFDKTQKTTIDINPRCCELVTILRWYHPKIQAGTAAGPSFYSPLRITVSADDIPAVIRDFRIDVEKEPMIFD